MILRCFAFLILGFNFLSLSHAEDIRLEQCGRVVGHEMNLWENFQLRPSPNQVYKALESGHKFYKVSLRKTKDNVWIVNHDADVLIKLQGELPKTVMIKDLTWPQILEWRHNLNNYAPIYRLSEYIKWDRGQLCWMLGVKDSADESFLKEVRNLNLENRTVVLTTSRPEYDLMMAHAQSAGLKWTIRVSDDGNYLRSLKPYYDNIWAVEIDPTDNIQFMIRLTKFYGLKAYVDSMRFSIDYELISSACEKVFNMGADYTQTNRAIECNRWLNSRR